MKRSARAILLTVAIALAHGSVAAAQDFGFEPPASVDDPALPEAMRDLAERVVPVYMDDDTDRYLANLAALQVTVGDPPAAHTTRNSLRERLETEQPAGRALVYDIYTHARAI